MSFSDLPLGVGKIVLEGCLLSRYYEISMTAKNLSRSVVGGAYYYIHNEGIENKNIFSDEEDCKVFRGFLEDYLSPQEHPEKTKKVFTVQGRSYRGIPHQPKNYYDKIELTAYGLAPNRFNLLLHHKTDSPERFIRSLCTRYSMYFNKKYHRTGSLFDGPYKSITIEDNLRLLHLTRYIHLLSTDNSSYEEFVGKRTTSWIKPKIILSMFDKLKTDLTGEVKSYRDFVEKYTPSQNESTLLEGIVLERRNHARNISKDLESNAIKTSFDTKNPSNITPTKLEVFTIVGVFLLLLAFGVRNVIMASTDKIESPEPSPTPLMIETVEVEPKTMLEIRITDGATSVNIRQEPTVQSNKIGEALEADTFEFTSADSGWYEIKLADGSAGYISERYIEEINN
ncbi:MAG: hypothetical protein UV74_C0002G0010 [Candidatus Woesebacteria bacterium GW2011_GWB1_43_14]|uniref:SH3b domain-containing protein n=1 Tax=Candidatus Woesebacteria bacterium GW2011_GWB1_43_14 TaxID=1618578 RepID=A0A0G1FUX0_9BACT|nr:MAG: hypothetical protein UV51_C0004G0057 [Candidatus Woesebacteria bacterium GW2011_GWC1_42_9]KKS98791.1 MAG: hypothetical protein UV74_C0002G0010 [Candidatus Woesebacteria bacterium GW2011_GWB1_43_14]